MSASDNDNTEGTTEGRIHSVTFSFLQQKIEALFSLRFRNVLGMLRMIRSTKTKNNGDGFIKVLTPKRLCTPLDFLLILTALRNRLADLQIISI